MNLKTLVDPTKKLDLKTLLLVCCLVLFGFIILRRAWVTEDAFITFRTVDNFINGFGLTWNIDERVQTFTNPLWMFLVSLFFFFTREAFFTSLALTIVLSISALALFARFLASSTVVGIFGVLALASSNAFVDFSTSGLENPLSHFLLVIFYILYFRRTRTSLSLIGLSFVFALIGLNRLDLLLICIPAWILAFIETPRHLKIRFLLAGVAPLTLWELFSLLYYGFLFPNTAYAKLNIGVWTWDLTNQGFAYLINSLTNDPITLILVVTSLIIGFSTRKKELNSLALGIGLYLIYIVKIGGDFMSGRFITEPVLCALILICQLDYSSLDARLSQLPFALVLMLNLCAPLPTFELTEPDLPQNLIEASGIANERLYYESTNSLANYRRDFPLYPLDSTACLDGLNARWDEIPYTLASNVGLFGYCAGPHVHILDKLALTDPLLARMPINGGKWRIGHLSRMIPEGYELTLKSGKNQIVNKDLANYYDHLVLITRGRLWDVDRLKAIWMMNTGQYDYLLDSSYPHLITRHLNQVNTIRPEGTPWNDPGNVIFENPGISIELDETCHVSQIELSLDHNDEYQVDFYRNNLQVYSAHIPMHILPSQGGLRVEQIVLPYQIQNSGYDSILIFPTNGDGLYSLGHLRLIQTP